MDCLVAPFLFPYLSYLFSQSVLLGDLYSYPIGCISHIECKKVPSTNLEGCSLETIKNYDLSGLVAFLVSLFKALSTSNLHFLMPCDLLDESFQEVTLRVWFFYRDLLVVAKSTHLRTPQFTTLILIFLAFSVSVHFQIQIFICSLLVFINTSTSLVNE